MPFSTVCFRWRPDGLSPTRALDEANARIMDAVNRTGEVFLSHTRLDDRFTIRLSVGNLRTEPRHVERAWELAARGGGGAEASAPVETPDGTARMQPDDVGG